MVGEEKKGQKGVETWIDLSKLFLLMMSTAWLPKKKNKQWNTVHDGMLSAIYSSKSKI